jgi:hypothetical protein
MVNLQNVLIERRIGMLKVIEERRLGRFVVAQDILLKFPEQVMGIFQEYKFLPIFCTFDYPMNEFRYDGYSEKFKLHREGTELHRFYICVEFEKRTFMHLIWYETKLKIR